MDSRLTINRDRESTIKALYSEIVRELPEANEEKTSFFDESTGTWYALTGRTQIDRLNVERARTYFSDVVNKYSKATPGTADFEKALFCAIAVETISVYLSGNPEHKRRESEKRK